MKNDPAFDFMSSSVMLLKRCKALFEISMMILEDMFDVDLIDIDSSDAFHEYDEQGNRLEDYKALAHVMDKAMDFVHYDEVQKKLEQLFPHCKGDFLSKYKLHQGRDSKIKGVKESLKVNDWLRNVPNPFQTMVENKETKNIHDRMDDAVKSAKKDNKVRDEKDLPLGTVMSKLKTSADEFVVGAAIEGTYSDHTNKLIQKHKKEGRQFGHTAINIDSFDGAQHNSSVTGQVSITSFNLTQISHPMCKDRVNESGKVLAKAASTSSSIN